MDDIQRDAEEIVRYVMPNDDYDAEYEETEEDNMFSAGIDMMLAAVEKHEAEHGKGSFDNAIIHFGENGEISVEVV